MRKAKLTAYLLLAALSFSASAQLNLPVRKIGGVDYYYHQVKKKETIYGISKDLGIPKEDIIKYNPSVANGLKKGQYLYFPISAYGQPAQQAATKPAVNSKHSHEVEPGQTLYGISKMYGVTVDALRKANPETSNGLKVGTILTIPVDAIDTQNDGTPYSIRQGETLFSIAERNGVELTDLLAANPNVSPDSYKAGDIILIPSPKQTQSDKDSEPDTVFLTDTAEKGDTYESLADEYQVPVEDLMAANPDLEKPKKGSHISIPVPTEEELTNTEMHEVEAEAYEEVYPTLENKDGCKFAIILPFESESDMPSKEAKLYQDFYRGFLLGMNDCTEAGIPVSLSVYDSYNHTLSSILKQVKETDMIFTADNMLAETADFGKKNSINVVNAFSPTDETFYENYNIIQLCTPSPLMYAAVRSHVDSTFSDYEIVFLKDDGSEDKPLIEYMKKSNLPQQTVSLSEASDSTMSLGSKTLFIPTSSSRNTLKAISKLTKALRKTFPEKDIRLLGYPEWAYYSEYEHYLKDIEACIFSRYNLFETEGDDNYRYWYGEKPIHSMPSMYSLGYDMAKYFTTVVNRYGKYITEEPEAYAGQQQPIDLERSSNWGGLVNKSVFLYQYNRNGIDKTVIK